MNEQLTEHFWRSEFACRGEDCCGHSAPVDLRLVWALEDLRQAIGLPLVIESGFRCRRHNAEIPGSSPTSYHPLGMAVDVRVPGGCTVRNLVFQAEQIPLFRNGGIGIYSNRVHLDIRKERTRW